MTQSLWLSINLCNGGASCPDHSLSTILRSCCLKLTQQRITKQRVRGGLRQLADHMNHVTKSMSNDLESPDSPKSVIRTYSNAARREGSVRHQDMSLRVLAINNNCKGGEGIEVIQELEMSDRSSSPSTLDIHCQDKRR